MNDPLGLFDEDTKGNDPLGLFEEKAGIGTGIKSSFANVGNMVDIAFTAIGGGAVALSGVNDKFAAQLEEDMRSRLKSREQWANPEGQEISGTGKLAGAVATLPMQILGMGLSPADTALKAKDAGESNTKALQAAGLDAAGNVAGMLLPGFKQGSMAVRGATGFGANAVQDYVTKSVIQDVLETEKGKKIFAPTLEDTLITGVIGAGSAAALGRNKVSGEKAKLDALLERQKAIDAAKAVEQRAKPLSPDWYRQQEQLGGKMDLAEQRFADDSSIKQQSLFDNSLEEANLLRHENNLDLGTDNWRIDENGMPIKADLSMELQNLQQPLQRNLWGDELPPKSEQEAFPLTQAIDEMPDAPWRNERDEGLDLLRGEIEAPGELKSAMMQSESLPAATRSGDPAVKVPFNFKKQGGGIKIDWSSEDGNKKLDFILKLLPKEYREYSGQIKQSFANRNAETLEWARFLEEVIPNRSTINPYEYDAYKDSTTAKKALDRDIAEKYGLMDIYQKKYVISSPGNKQRGGILFDFGKKKQTPDATDIPRIQKQIDELGRRYVGGGLSFDEFKEENTKLITQKLEAERLEKRRQESIPAKSVEPIFPGFNVIPVGTKIKASHGLNYPKGSEGTVVGTFDFRDGDKAYKLPVVDFGDGKGRKILPMDIEEVFAPRTITSPGNKQRGGLLIDPRAKARQQIESIVGKKANAIPDNPVAADVVQQALSEGKDGKGINMLQSGSTSTAMKRGSAAIEGASRIVQNAVKKADLAIRNKVFPAENALRRLPLEQLQSLADVFKAEMLSNTKFDGQAMADSGFSVEQIRAYTAIREMFDDTLRVQNEVRVAQGKKPIDAKEAYVSSRWQGDFRRPVYDKEGNLKWYLAADSRMGLESQTKALLKEFPELVIDKAKDHVVKASTNKTDLQSMYSTMLDILGRDDPAIERIRQAVEEQTVAQGKGALGQEKHFKQKGNVRGFVGDRPGSSPKREALGLFQQQMQYAKNAYKWAEFQKAADDIKTIVGDADLQQQQPNNVKYIRDYWKNALGYGETKAISAIEDGIRDMGVSPQVIKNGVGSIKSFFILQKLAASAGYTAANLIQTSNVLPYMVYLHSQGYKGNPLKALSMGLVGGFAMGTGHYLTSAGGDYSKIIKGWPDGEFYINAFKYAEDNGVTARSVYDESPVETSFSKIGQAANIAGKTMTIPETFVRSMAFMTYVQQLKDSGKFNNLFDTEGKPDYSPLFQKAEELVNMSMVDYRETERPMMFSKMGTAGNFLNTLQTFPMSFYNQWNFYAREAAKGNVGPLLTAIVLQGTIAGAMGIPGFDDLDKLYMALKDMLPAKEWQKVRESELLSDPKMWMLKNLGESSVYGVLSDKSGLGMTSRVAAPGAGAMLQSPAGPITDIFKQGVNVGKAALDPTNTTKLAQAAMSVAPVGLQGALETAPFMEGITHNQTPKGANYLRSTDLADRKGGYVRTPEEESLRKWGFRSQKEVATRDITYSESRATKTAREKSQTIPDKFYDALRRGKVDEAKELNTVYTKLTGKRIDDKQLENQVREEMFDAVQRSKNAAKSLEAMKNIKRMDDLLKEIQ